MANLLFVYLCAHLRAGPVLPFQNRSGGGPHLKHEKIHPSNEQHAPSKNDFLVVGTTIFSPGLEMVKNSASMNLTGSGGSGDPRLFSPFLQDVRKDAAVLSMPHH
mmetsp:Transcript_42393/g.71633  ORF Transcript_42393/g.71633 Transcript_42393/m.71633 type:complete len:105 (+) Transcript_42393:669-983(+)